MEAARSDARNATNSATSLSVKRAMSFALKVKIRRLHAHALRPLIVRRAPELLTRHERRAVCAIPGERTDCPVIGEAALQIGVRAGPPPAVTVHIHCNLLDGYRRSRTQQGFGMCNTES